MLRADEDLVVLLTLASGLDQGISPAWNILFLVCVKKAAMSRSTVPVDVFTDAVLASGGMAEMGSVEEGEGETHDSVRGDGSFED